ncbi:MAG: heparan-alpha-glucosaminide N-acetyltransferase domain-containing protein [Tissierellia bacterium]|nr:heparan-alpha-glucosaminide N-acetyltransferase domain-containing protein [Tissierellia bacterium]
MVIFHLLYNINIYRNITWYQSNFINRFWQLSIAISFFIISAITSTSLSSDKNIKRGIKTSLLGFIISLITYLFARDQLIIWGVLNGLGLSMIISGLIQKKYRINIKTFPIFILLFISTYRLERSDFESIPFFHYLYENNYFFLGFPSRNFFSTDYFPLIPWIFIYLAGLGLGNYLKSKNFFENKGKDNPLAYIGRHSMVIYLSHQIILYPIVSLILG